MVCLPLFAENIRKIKRYYKFMSQTTNSINSPKEVIHQTINGAVEKSQLGISRLVLLGLLAGVYIAMGGFLSLFVSFGMPALTNGNPALVKILAGATFPLGLILVVLVGAELFTGNAARLVPAALSKKISWGYLAKNWALTWITNMIGAVLFVYLFIHLVGLIDKEPWASNAISLAEGKCSMTWGVAFLKGIVANWLVCLAVWLGSSSTSATGRMLGIWFPVMAFVTLGYEHSIANMFYIPLGMFLGADISIQSFFLDNLVPVTIGNIVGGGLLVGAAYWYIWGERKR